VGPWVEELFFRGFLWESIVQHHQSHLGKWSRSCGLLTATFCFAALHINWAISFQYQWPMLMAWLCCGGLSFSLYFWRKSLIVPICVHGCANAVMLTPWSFS
jgi:membrane protease YdiL (CAAX protease family)